MPRERIDWDNLQPLARKTRDGATPEDLAKRRFNMQKAKHKGRCHITNQKRRQQALEQRAIVDRENAKQLDKYRKRLAAIRAYWRGEKDTHP